jgi:glutamate/tyrosine decarboxylase-like PLP-dependent enzyme
MKIAHRLGIGRSAVKLVETDGTGRMDIASLCKSIADDLGAGRSPVMVVGTAGTTNAGMIDPLESVGDVARRFGLWFHVDAAWGGALLASPKLRGALDGIAEADSVTIDTHKWFATTMGAGMYLCRDPRLLSSVFGVEGDYMPSNDISRDPYVTSALWSRRFAGLKLFLNLAAGGWSGYAAHVEHACGLISELRLRLEAEGWRIVNDSPAAVLAAVPPPSLGTPAEVVERVLKSGVAWVSVANFERQPTVRACITNGKTTLADVTTLAQALNGKIN